MEHCLPIRVINLQRDYDGKEHSTKLLFDKGHWWVYWVSSLWFQRENLQNVLATYLLLRSWARRFFYGYVRCSYCCLAADIIYLQVWERKKANIQFLLCWREDYYCVGSLPEWVTGNCLASVLRVISQLIYFESSRALRYGTISNTMKRTLEIISSKIFTIYTF